MSYKGDLEIYKKAVERAKNNGVDTLAHMNIVVFLEKEIDNCREKITAYEDHVDTMNDIITELKRRCESKATTLEAVQENTTAEIIKALADNGYTNISVDFYKTEREE